MSEGSAKNTNRKRNGGPLTSQRVTDSARGLIMKLQSRRKFPASWRHATHLGIGTVAWLAFGLLQHRVHWTRLAYTLLYAHMMWGFVLGFLGLFTRFCRRGNAGTRYVADASYWIYVVHLPLVVALQVLVGQWFVPWPVKYPALCAAALLLLFLSYHYFVRATFIGAQLNGRRYPRAWPWRDL